MTATDSHPTAIRWLSPAESRDPELLTTLTDLVNDVYRSAEHGLWTDGFARTTPSELTGLIAAGEIAIATNDGAIAGVVRLHDLTAEASEFGMLAADPGHRGIGVGRALVDFVERESRERGVRVMRLELLVPRSWSHPSKEFLGAWYDRRGYRVVGTRTVEAAHPHLAPQLATPCDVRVYEKELAG